MEVPEAPQDTEEIPLSPIIPNSTHTNGITNSTVDLTPRLQSALQKAHSSLLKLKERIPPTSFLRANGVIIGSSIGGGFCFTASANDAVLLWRTSSDSWSLPVPLSIFNIGIGAIIGTYKGNFAILLTEISVDDLLERRELTIKSGVHRVFSVRAGGVSSCHISNIGCKYTMRHGFIGGIGYRLFRTRMGNVKWLYPSIKGVTTQAVLKGQLQLKSDMNNIDLYRLMRTIDDCGRDPSYY